MNGQSANNDVYMHFKAEIIQCGGVGGNSSSDTSGMDDILIVTSRQSEPAILWANYLKTRFDKITKQRGRQPFNFLHIKIDEGPITSDLSKRCQYTKLQIVILCSSLISLPGHFLMSQLSVILKPDIVLGILLEVPEERIMEIQKNSLPSFKKWRRCVVRNQDQSFVGNVLGIATDILGRALCQRPVCTPADTAASVKQCHNDAFTILPRKVKIGQNKVVALLNEPLLKDDWIKIKIEKTGEIIDIINFKKRNPYTLQFTIPESCMEVSTMIEIKIEKNEKELGSRPVKCESRLRELEQILKGQDSPLEFMCHSLGIATSDKAALDTYLHQTFQKNLPPNFHLVSGAGPQKQHGFFAHKESSSEEYPTLLHFAARWGLEHLCMQLMDCPGGDVACEMRNYSGKTPAELAEVSGFTKLAGSLKSFSQMNEFTTMYHYFKGISSNSSDASSPASTNTTKVVISKKPASPNAVLTSPKQNGLCTLAQQEYMEMSGSDQDSASGCHSVNAVTNLNYINVESTTKDEEMQKNFNDNNVQHSTTGAESEIMSNELRILEPAYYDSNEINRSDAFSQECSNVLENCSQNSSSAASAASSDYMLQPSNIPVVQPDFGDYLTHPSNKPVECLKNIPMTTSNVYPAQQLIEKNAFVFPDVDSEVGSSHLKLNFTKKDSIKSKSGTLRRQGSDTSKTSVDDELLEIMNDFKNNVFTIQEVEQLVVSWKNRNDVQQSYKDKQEQLQQMRTEYERLQDQMKEKMKRPTPFERVKKLFSRNKSIVNENGTEHLDGDPKSPTAGRPMSSLSLQSISSSSSSSGRMSTGSVCSGASLGDSGTHSDHEDRRQGTCRVGTPGSLMLDNYVIPPTPRPASITTPTTPPISNGKYFPNFPKTPTETTSTSAEHYVLFPSNVPVYPEHHQNHHQPQHDYINFSGLNTIEETKETADITLQPIKVQKPEAIYAPIKKQNSPDLCSSFKPSTSPSVIYNDAQTMHFTKHPTVLNGCTSYNGRSNTSHRKGSDPFKNIDELDAKTMESLKNLTKSIDGCNASLSIAHKIQKSNSAQDCSHDYINV